MRRARILEAAKETFQAHGLEGASLREIAKRAGYTPSALYFYYRSKEEIYGDLVAESLDRLNAAVSAAVVRKGSAPVQRLKISALAFFRFYEQQPRDLELGFYLFQGMRPYGLTRELNIRLNERLLDALKPVASALEAMGRSPEESRREVAGLFGHCVGVLLLQHTGRIKLFSTSAAELFDAYLEQFSMSRTQ